MHGRYVAIAVAMTATLGTVGCSHKGKVTVTEKPVSNQSTVSKSVTEEDLYHFNCLTMGNHLCGPKWQILNAGWKGQVKLENPKQDPTNCKVLVGDTTYIDCPNGRIYTS